MPAMAIQTVDLATRIRRLRGQRPQPVIAEQAGVTLRAYQAWEGGKGITWRNLEQLASVHDVDPNWLLYGDEPPRAPEGQLDRIERKLDRLERLIELAGLSSAAVIAEEEERELEEAVAQPRSGHAANNGASAGLPRLPKQAR